MSRKRTWLQFFLNMTSSDKKDEPAKRDKTGKLWTESENKEVKKLLAEGKSVKEISDKVGRTTKAIDSRIYLWIKKEIAAGGNREEIMKKYKMKNTSDSGFSMHWSADEVSTLKQYIQQEGKTISQISTLLNRKEQNVINKLISIAYNEIQKGENKDKVLAKYRINKADYEKYVAKKDRQVISSNIDLIEITQKIDTLTNLLNLVLKIQKDQSEDIKRIKEFCDQ